MTKDEENESEEEEEDEEWIAAATAWVWTYKDFYRLFILSSSHFVWDLVYISSF